MNTSTLANDLGIAAAEIVCVLVASGKFGRGEGFGCADMTRIPLQSDYVRLAGELEGVSVHIAQRGACDRTAHPYWVWIEKI